LVVLGTPHPRCQIWNVPNDFERPLDGRRANLVDFKAMLPEGDERWCAMRSRSFILRSIARTRA
jgi:hypothetical protein